MALPGFRKRRSANGSNADGSTKEGMSPENVAIIKRLTKTRRNVALISSGCYLLAFIFLVLVEIGNTKGTKVLGDIYFFKLDLANIIPNSAPSLTLMNSIARTLGLHDFYQVGLWNFCEGYEDEGITFCSTPTNLWWFNPVEILKNELFAGASIPLPNQVNEILNYLHIASNIMFGFFLASTILDFLMIFIAPIVLYSRWWSMPVGILSFIAFILATVAAAIGTAMSLIFKYALTSQSDLNIQAEVGTKMLAFSWIAVGFTFISFVIHSGLCCCCTSRRDVRTGRKGSQHMHTGSMEETPKSGSKLPSFGKNSSTS
ncbi:integral membrane protein [Apiospora marii]|uniref:Integral membrane protein n=1 Tax=Apiospora marii TaxID=335849 RepID=A0ABR1S5I4_9PEZI